MAHTITMPPLSQTTDTVTLVGWLVKTGDKIEKGAAIADVETDKVSTQVESYASGTVLKISGKPGDVISVGAVIAVVGEPGEALPDESAAGGPAISESGVGSPEPSRPGNAAHESNTVSETQKRQARQNKSVRATALVQNLAEKRGVDLSFITGSGPGGLIVKEDVLKFIAGGLTAVNTRTGAGDAGSAPWSSAPLSRIQRAVAESMIKSAREIPQYNIRVRVYLDTQDGLMARQAALAGNVQDGKPSTYAFYVFACARALVKFSGINGFYRDGAHSTYRSINIGFAMSVGNDLFVPVIKNTDKKSLEEIDGEIKSMSALLKAGRPDAGDLSECTFTVSNLGIYPVDDFTGMVTPGQAGILAIGRSRRTLTAEDDGSLRIRTSVLLCGSFDHRIVNGSEGAAFLARIKSILEGDNS